MKINSKTMAVLNPCQDRFNNYKEHYGNKSFTLHEFLSLDKITAKDKIWVTVRIIPRELVEVFAIDCALKAAARYTAHADANAVMGAAYCNHATANAYAAAEAAAYAAAVAVDDISAANVAYAATSAANQAAAYYADAADYAADTAAYAAAVAYAATDCALKAAYADAYASSLEDSVDALIYITKNL